MRAVTVAFWISAFVAAFGFAARREYGGMLWVGLAVLCDHRGDYWYGKWKQEAEAHIASLKKQTEFIKRLRG